MIEIWKELKEDGISKVLFGDIHLEHLIKYRLKNLKEVGIAAGFPLWQKNTTDLAHQFIEKGFKAVVVSVSSSCLDKSYVGRHYDRAFINDLPSHVDPCGEQGEFHTLVYEGPIFKKPIPWKMEDIIFKDIPKNDHQSNHHSNIIRSNRSDNDRKHGSWFCELKVD